MSRITIDTLSSKVEYIVLSLGGKPDGDLEQNKRNQEEFDQLTAVIKD